MYRFVAIWREDKKLFACWLVMIEILRVLDVWWPNRDAAVAANPILTLDNHKKNIVVDTLDMTFDYYA